MRGVFVQTQRMKTLKALLALGFAAGLVAASSQNEYVVAAGELDQLITRHYAYLDKLPDERLPQSDLLDSEREAVRDSRMLLAYAEKRIASLADHHAITGSSFRDSWAVVPTYSDLWIVSRDDEFIVDAVREKSPAADAGVRTGDVILAIEGISIDQAVAVYWQDLGLSETSARTEYAARVLAAGRRDRSRRISIRRASGGVREVVLPSLYDLEPEENPPVSVCSNDDYSVVRFNNSLGDFATIDAFDQAMRTIPNESVLVIDLRDTPSGGNTTVARGIMGWFVAEPHGYQIHNRPAEERETGVPRQWIEQVLPRSGRYRSSLPVVLVGRWTGSMGEGVAVGFASMGAEVRGTMMAGLNGSVEDLRVGETDLFIKLPTERLLTVTGQPREEFVPAPLPNDRAVLWSCQV